MFLALFYYGVKINVQQMVPWYDPLKKSDLIDGKITNEDELIVWSKTDRNQKCV